MLYGEICLRYRADFEGKDIAGKLVLTSSQSWSDTRSRATCASSSNGMTSRPQVSAPIATTHHALKKAGMTFKDIDLVEINEAFAPVPMAWLRETDFEHEQINVNGGAIAIGHPLGCTGARLMITLLNELERTDGRYGLQTMCEGGGQANVTIIERL